jgi:sortase A
MSKSLECVFWFITAVALGIYGLSIAETRLYQVYLDWQFAEQLKAPPPAPVLGVPLPAALSSVPPPVAIPKARTLEGQSLGRLEIPSIHLSAIVAEGVATRTLRRSVGHVPGTALPGGRGNVGLSAHRDTFFRHLGELRKDDVITITTLDGSFEYVVESTTIVDPDESVVLHDAGRPTLTLVTCYPFYYVGPAPKRFVVHAGLAGY